MTECTQRTLEFHQLGRRKITARFDAPAITSDAGGLLLREVDEKFGFLEQFAACFDDSIGSSSRFDPSGPRYRLWSAVTAALP